MSLEKISKAVELLRELEEDVDAKFGGDENMGVRGYLKISIHNIIIALGREPYANHEIASGKELTSSQNHLP